MKLHDAHWTHRDFKQRMTIAQWRELLLGHRDTVIFGGLVEQLVARDLGAGVVEVGKQKEPTDA